MDTPIEKRKRARRVKEDLPDYDRASYTRGWESGINGGSYGLENADGRGEPKEWYHGYMDAATGREKWHRPLCPAHHNEEGGCGRA